MAVYQGNLVQYKTNNGSVPAITLDQRDANGDQAVLASATVVDLLVLGTGTPTRIYSVTKDSGTTEATVTTAGRAWVPA